MKLIVAEVAKQCREFYGSRTCISVFKRAHQRDTIPKQLNLLLTLITYLH